MTWLSDKRNLAWTVGIAVAALAFFGVQMWTALTVNSRLNPRGTPLLINAMSVPAANVMVGTHFRVILDAEKRRDCEPHAQMVWINSVGEERPFVIETWPYVEPGHGSRQLSLWSQVPEVLQPGAFRLQVRGLWRCQEEYYPISSPQTAVEIVEPAAGPAG